MQTSSWKLFGSLSWSTHPNFKLCRKQVKTNPTPLPTSHDNWYESTKRKLTTTCRKIPFQEIVWILLIHILFPNICVETSFLNVTLGTSLAFYLLEMNICLKHEQGAKFMLALIYKKMPMFKNAYICEKLISLFIDEYSLDRCITWHCCMNFFFF